MDAELVLILSMIPFGRDNAVSRQQLKTLAQMDDRKVRECIERLRDDHLILHSTKGGYYRPTETETDEIIRFVRTERKRAKSVLKGVRAAEEYLEEMGISC